MFFVQECAGCLYHFPKFPLTCFRCMRVCSNMLDKCQAAQSWGNPGGHGMAGFWKGSGRTFAAMLYYEIARIYTANIRTCLQKRVTVGWCVSTCPKLSEISQMLGPSLTKQRQRHPKDSKGCLLVPSATVEQTKLLPMPEFDRAVQPNCFTLRKAPIKSTITEKYVINIKKNI